MDAKDKQIEELKALVAALTKRVAELELELAKAKKDSSTSSKPPSSDIVKPKPKKKPGQRKRRKGGQRGHQRQLREPLPPMPIGCSGNSFAPSSPSIQLYRSAKTPSHSYKSLQFDTVGAPVHPAANLYDLEQ